MEATKDYISLETAKLLKGCPNSNCIYIENAYSQYGSKKEEYGTVIIERELRTDIYRGKTYPAYTWQEILWEYPKEFFEETCIIKHPHIVDRFCYWNIERVTEEILKNLRLKKYDEADLFFRENCILIKN
jgi:hypothetical protein